MQKLSENERNQKIIYNFTSALPHQRKWTQIWWRSAKLWKI